MSRGMDRVVDLQDGTLEIASCQLPRLASFLPKIKTASSSTKGIPMAQWLKALSGHTPDRRRRQRIVQYFDCTWSSAWREESARISNLSPTGCYIESRFTVPAQGTVVSDLTISLPTGAITLRGTVIDATPGVGFAVRFAQLDTHAHDCLNALAEATQVQR